MALSSGTRPSLRRARRREDGYVLLTLLLTVALMGIFALAVITPIKFDLQRDREQELIHRGVQYSRAIRNYYKKYGRYPTRLEDLDNTNNLRYLRKHYKDPVTGKDFKLLRYGDPDLSMTGSIGGGTIAGANTVGQMNASGSSSGFGSGNGSSAFGQSSSGQSSSGQTSFGQSSGFGGSSNGGFGGNSGGGSGGGFSNSGSPNNSGASSGSGTSATDSSQGGTSTGNSTSADGSSTQGGNGSSNGQGNNQTFGGGPIVGVASISKDATIREFNKKKKYNQWQFIYDPTADRGGLILTPNQPQLQLSGNLMGTNGQPGNTNPSGSSFGQPTGFGNNSPGLGAPATPSQPPSSLSQQ
jgi:type II secretory pathway pseudopilin PulG